MTIEFKNGTGSRITITLQDSSANSGVWKRDITNGNIERFNPHAGAFLARITLSNKKSWQVAVNHGYRYRVDGYNDVKKFKI